ncbi:MAG: hypothetical protein ACXWLT_00375 [Rhizomicrobium sp.]
MKADKLLAEAPAAADWFAALAEQTALEGGLLPPQDDQSWREMDVLRIFRSPKKSWLREARFKDLAQAAALHRRWPAV